MRDSKPVETPIAGITKIADDEHDELRFPYREVVGSLLYASCKTRPDLACAVNYESSFVEHPKKLDVTNVKRTLRYLNGSTSGGIKYVSGADTELSEAFCDSGFAGCEDTRRSTSGYIIMFCGGPIAWCSRRQPIVSLSSTEAEFITAAECTKELRYLKCLISEILNAQVKVRLNVDNQSAIKLIKNGVFNKRNKHIDVRYKFISEKIQNKDILVEYCPIDRQLADMFTKALNKNQFKRLRNEIMYYVN
ncbi:hypothetical protein Trydic_g22722 [Trypoxylus dichotomus]